MTHQPLTLTYRDDGQQLVIANAGDPHFFTQCTRLTRIGFRCEHEDPMLHPQTGERLAMIQCASPAAYVVETCDAPELIHEPDTYRVCREHALPMLGAFLLDF